MEFLGLLWNLWELITNLFLLWLVLYSGWHGMKLEAGNFYFELYGIARFFK